MHLCIYNMYIILYYFCVHIIITTQHAYTVISIKKGREVVIQQKDRPKLRLRQHRFSGKENIYFPTNGQIYKSPRHWVVKTGERADRWAGCGKWTGTGEQTRTNNDTETQGGGGGGTKEKTLRSWWLYIFYKQVSFHLSVQNVSHWPSEGSSDAPGYYIELKKIIWPWCLPVKHTFPLMQWAGENMNGSAQIPDLVE